MPSITESIELQASIMKKFEEITGFMEPEDRKRFKRTAAKYPDLLAGFHNLHIWHVNFIGVGKSYVPTPTAAQINDNAVEFDPARYTILADPQILAQMNKWHDDVNEEAIKMARLFPKESRWRMLEAFIAYGNGGNGKIPQGHSKAGRKKGASQSKLDRDRSLVSQYRKSGLTTDAFTNGDKKKQRALQRAIKLTYKTGDKK